MNYHNIYARDPLINPQIPKLATPREISLLAIKEAGGRAKNNIKILNPLDHISCLANCTLTSSPQECITPDVSPSSERNSLNNKFQRMCNELNERIVPLLIYCLPHMILTEHTHTMLSARGQHKLVTPVPCACPKAAGNLQTPPKQLLPPQTHAL